MSLKRLFYCNYVRDVYNYDFLFCMSSVIVHMQHNRLCMVGDSESMAGGCEGSCWLSSG